MTTLTERALEGTGRWLDDRFHGARGFRVLFRKIFPDHWTFLLGEIASARSPSTRSSSCC